MKIVVDTNVVFSAILNSNGNIADLILNSEGIFEFYSCNLLHDELRNHEPKIYTIAKYSSYELSHLKTLIFDPIRFIYEDIIPFECWHKALPLVRDVDMDDIAFVALNEFIQATLWTGDLKLLHGLKSKGYQQVISTNELLQIREEIDKKNRKNN